MNNKQQPKQFFIQFMHLCKIKKMLSMNESKNNNSNIKKLKTVMEN